jgi:hypothetical protein
MIYVGYDGNVPDLVIVHKSSKSSEFLLIEAQRYG